RLLAYMISLSPDVERLRAVVRRRLMDPPRIEAAQKNLTSMLRTLWAGGFIRLDPPPPAEENPAKEPTMTSPATSTKQGSLGALLALAREKSAVSGSPAASQSGPTVAPSVATYEPKVAYPTPALSTLLSFRG